MMGSNHFECDCVEARNFRMTDPMWTCARFTGDVLNHSEADGLVGNALSAC